MSEIKQKENEQVVLFNIQICDILNNNILSIFIGIFSGFAVTIIMNEMSNFISSGLCFFAAILLGAAINKNSKFDDYCKVCLLDNLEIRKQPKQSIKDKVYEIHGKRIKYCFYSMIFLSIFIFGTGIVLLKPEKDTIKCRDAIQMIDKIKQQNNQLHENINALDNKIDFLLKQNNKIYEKTSDLLDIQLLTP